MFGIFNKSWENIDEKDIRDIVFTNKMREDIHLDYKQKINVDDDLLTDVCSFANSQGGYIICGISEDENREEGYPEKIIGISKPEVTEIQLREKIKEHIIPHLVNWKSKIIHVDSLLVLLIYVPNSTNKPHFVKHKNYHPFPVRQARNKNYWSMNEVKNIIIARMDSEYRMNDEFENIHLNNPNESSPHPFLSLVALPTYFGQDIIDVGREDIKAFLVDNEYAFLPKNNSYIGVTGKLSYCLEGIEKVENDSYIDMGTKKFLRIYRNGAIEYSSANISQKPNSFLYLESIKIGKCITEFTKCYKSLYQIIPMYDPVSISVFFKNITGAKIYKGQMPIEGNNTSPKTWSKSILDIRVSFPVDDEIDVAKTLSDRFANSFGYESI